MLIPYDVNAISSPTVQNDGTVTIYNMMGLKLSHPTKGVNIVNGKKVLVR